MYTVCTVYLELLLFPVQFVLCLSQGVYVLLTPSHHDEDGQHEYDLLSMKKYRCNWWKENTMIMNVHICLTKISKGEYPIYSSKYRPPVDAYQK